MDRPCTQLVLRFLSRLPYQYHFHISVKPALASYCKGGLGKAAPDYSGLQPYGLSVYARVIFNQAKPKMQLTNVFTLTETPSHESYEEIEALMGWLGAYKNSVPALDTGGLSGKLSGAKWEELWGQTSAVRGGHGVPILVFNVHKDVKENMQLLYVPAYTTNKYELTPANMADITVYYCLLRQILKLLNILAEKPLSGTATSMGKGTVARPTRGGIFSAPDAAPNPLIASEMARKARMEAHKGEVSTKLNALMKKYEELLGTIFFYDVTQTLSVEQHYLKWDELYVARNQKSKSTDFLHYDPKDPTHTNEERLLYREDDEGYVRV